MVNSAWLHLQSGLLQLIVGIFPERLSKQKAEVVKGKKKKKLESLQPCPVVLVLLYFFDFLFFLANDVKTFFFKSQSANSSHFNYYLLCLDNNGKKRLYSMWQYFTKVIKNNSKFKTYIGLCRYLLNCFYFSLNLCWTDSLFFFFWFINRTS